MTRNLAKFLIQKTSNTGHNSMSKDKLKGFKVLKSSLIS